MKYKHFTFNKIYFIICVQQINKAAVHIFLLGGECVEINEISKRYNIDIKKLQIFEENNIITIRENFSDEDLNMLGTVCSLYNGGLSIKEIKDFMAVYNSGNSNSLISFLNGCRHNMLDEIHEKQKSLDNLDYIIYEIKNKKFSIY